MGRTFLRQDTQIRNSDLYDDTLVAGGTLESGQTTIEGDLNALRSQINRILKADGSLNWYDDVVTVNSKKRGLQDLNSDLNELEEQKTLRRVTLLADVAVAGGTNYVILSVAGTETPAEVAAVAGTVDGAVVAQSALSGGGFAAHELTEIAGPNAVLPKNLLIVRNAATGESIQSSGREVFGLLQYESTGVDGAAFNDTSAGNRAKISFVRQNATYDDLEAVPTADIGGLSVNYAYVSRTKLDNAPEEAWLAGAGFVDYAASVTVSLDAAVDNQSGDVTQTAKNITWRIDDTYRIAFQDPSGAVDILAVKPAAGGDEVEINGVVFDVNSTSPADFAEGAKFDTSGTEIDVGVTAGVIETTASADLRILGAGELYFDDGNQAAAGWAQTAGIKLSDTAQEWADFATIFGEVSLLKATSITKRRAPVYAVVTSTTNADTDVGGASGGTNLDAQLPDMSIGTFTQDYDVYLNGKRLRPGANAAANHDYYPGTSLANGQLKFEFKVKAGDQLTVIPYVR